MAEVKGYPVFKGTFVDHSGIGDTGLDVRIVNGFRDPINTVTKRPALSSNISELGTPGTYGTYNMYGIYKIFGFPSGSPEEFLPTLVVSASGNNYAIHRILFEPSTTGMDALVSEIRSTSKTNVEQDIKYYGIRHEQGVNSTGDIVSFLCFSGIILEYNYTTQLFTDITPAEVPNPVRDIAYINRRLLAIDSTDDRVYYSATGDPSDFSIGGGGGSFQAESQVDTIRRIVSQGNDLYIFGPKSVDLYYNSGDTTFPFERYNGSEVKTGLINSQALVNVDGTFYFYNDAGQIVRLRGTDYEIVSNKINVIISRFLGEGNTPTEFNRMTDFQIDGRHFIMLTLTRVQNIDTPLGTDSAADGLSLVYDIGLDDWYVWTDDSSIQRLGWYSSVFAPLNNVSLVCDSNLQKVRYLSFQDADYSSNKETLVVTSANIDLGSHKRKSAHMMTARVKGTVGPTVQYREGPVSSPIATGTNPFFTLVSGETIDDEGTFMRVPRLGQYRVRQYRFTHSDNSAFSIGDVTEEVEVLGS